MTTLNDFIYTDEDDDVMAAHVNVLQAAALRSEYSNVETLSATRKLLDVDTPIQSFNCNGADRYVDLPDADLDDNHVFYIKNSTSSGSWVLTIRSAASSALVALAPGESAICYPNGSGTYEVYTQQKETVYKITPTVASNNLTITITHADGSTPTTSRPLWFLINGQYRKVTAALSVTLNAATNWCNAGGAELATKEVDYFVYVGYNATDGVVVGTSRIPYAKKYGDFSTTSTNEKYCRISTITNAASGDPYEVIGRFAATLSAGAGYTWSVPTYASDTLIQKPINETRTLNYLPATTGVTVGNGTWVATYKLTANEVKVSVNFTLGSTSAITGGVTMTVPFSSAITILVLDLLQDSGTQTYKGFAQIAASTVNVWVDNVSGTYPYVAYLSSTVPFTWTTNDYITFFGTYLI